MPFALIVILGYEFSLLTLGLKNFVFYGPRNDFISANREGLVSSFGYLAVCLIGIEVGRKVFQTLYDKNSNQGEKEDKRIDQKKRENSVLK